MITTIDDFLESRYYDDLRNTIKSERLPWYYFEEFLSEEEKEKDCLQNYFFLHTFYDDGNVTSNFFPMLVPAIEKLESLSLIKVCANQYTLAENLVTYRMSADLSFLNEETAKKTTVGILYLDDSDGKTIFETGEEVQSKQNRIVLFPGNLKYSLTNCTNMKRRNIVKFNFISK